MGRDQSHSPFARRQDPTSTTPRTLTIPDCCCPRITAQSIHLLPHALNPDAVARFLRFCPGLAKASIGEVLGERDLFYEQVRQAFIETFMFKGMCLWYVGARRCMWGGGEAACCKAGLPLLQLA